MARLSPGLVFVALLSAAAAGCRAPESNGAADARTSEEKLAAEEAGGAARAGARARLIESLPKQEDGTAVLDLPLCLKLAFERNRGLESSRLSDLSTQLGILSSRTAFYPSITASGSHSANGSESRSGSLSISQDTPWGTAFSASLSESWAEGSRTASASVGIDQPLLAGAGRTAARHSLTRAEIGARISRADLELSAQSLLYNVTASYYSAAGQLEVVKVNRRAMARAQVFLERTKTFRDVGRKTVLDVSNSEIQVAEREISVAQAARRLADALDDLKDDLDLDPEMAIAIKPVEVELEEFDTDDAQQTLEIEPPDAAAGRLGAVSIKHVDKKAPGGPRETVKTIFEPQRLDYGPLLEEALANRLEVVNARWRLQQEKLDLALRVNDARPDLDLSLDYSVSRTDDSFSGAASFTGDDDSWSLGLSYSWPWGKISDKVALEQARLDVRQSELDVAGTIISVKLQVREQLRLLRNTEQNIFAFAMKIKGAYRALEAAKILVEHGKADNFMIIEAEDDLLSAETGFIQALLDYRTQLSRLDLRLGRRTRQIDCGLVDGDIPPGRQAVRVSRAEVEDLGVRAAEEPEEPSAAPVPAPEAEPE